MRWNGTIWSNLMVWYIYGIDVDTECRICHDLFTLSFSLNVKRVKLSCLLFFSPHHPWQKKIKAHQHYTHIQNNILMEARKFKRGSGLFWPSGVASTLAVTYGGELLGGTITLLHMWPQDGHCSRFSLDFLGWKTMVARLVVAESVNSYHVCCYF